MTDPKPEKGDNMKRYTDPELEIVSFETSDVTNFGEGEGPDIPSTDLSEPTKNWFAPKW